MTLFLQGQERHRVCDPAVDIDVGVKSTGSQTHQPEDHRQQQPLQQRAQQEVSLFTPASTTATARDQDRSDQGLGLPGNGLERFGVLERERQ